MTTSLLAALLPTLALLAAAPADRAPAADLKEPGAGGVLVLPDPGRPDPPSPPLTTRLPDGLRDAVGDAWVLADVLLEHNERCRDLFAPYERDPQRLLRQTRYAAPNLALENRLCHAAHAFTVVHSPVTHICRSFRSLPPEHAAATLIHEALHYAGQPEAPVHRDAPTASEISARVRRACS